MFTKHALTRIMLIAASSVFSLSTMQSVYAGPGRLATSPLFLSTLVEPNLFFTLDDSGSMDWELVVDTKTNGITSNAGLPFAPKSDTSLIGYLHPTWKQLYDNTNFGGVLPPSDAGFDDGDDYWVFRHHIGNKLYYNPDLKYLPWPGTKADGSPMFKDAIVQRAPDDPVYRGQTTDLTTRFKVEFNSKQYDLYLPTYYIWEDSNDNGLIESSDSHTKVEIAPTDTEAMQNFANWWVYYRSRINTTKAAIGAVISNTDAMRMGLYLFNGPPNRRSTAQLTELASMTDPATKRAFLEAFYATRIYRNPTPSRKALKAVGDHFAANDSNAILPAAQGGECQQNFNVFVSDGFWNQGSPDVGNRDADGGTGENNTIFDGGNYADSVSNTLADVAMKYYETDLRKNLADKVPIQENIDEAAHQHLVNFMIAFGIKGKLAATVNPAAPDFAWPTPKSGDVSTVDDMIHAAYNSRGEFFNAQNIVDFEQALSTTITSIDDQSATAAAVSVNSAQLSEESVVYVANFDSTRWSGELSAFKIDPSTGVPVAAPIWQAAQRLTARNFITDARTIVTYDGDNGIPFVWNKLTKAQKSDLKTSPTGKVDSDAVGAARLNYLRGKRDNEFGRTEIEGNFFRQRASLLGDLVNSGPVFVGVPSLNWPDTAPFPTAIGARYSDFKNGAGAARDGVIYVGANSGFVHGFAESDGAEVLAYAPNNLFSTATGSGYHYLTDANYQHRYYNDLTPTVADIYANLGNGTQWHTVLISGQRGGGRGIFALDITDPSTFNESNADKIVLWEFDNTDDADLGFTYSRPQIGLANNGRWVAIFGNGYNHTGDGAAKLFIVDIAAGLDGDWQSGDYSEISTGVGQATVAGRNGLATPSLADLDGNGTIDRAYAGDLEGNMWAFDLSSNLTENWGISGNNPLFTSIEKAPITTKPALAKHPTIADQDGNAPNVIVSFGSGQYLVDTDKNSKNKHYFYGVWDNGASNHIAADLVQQTYDNSFAERVLSRTAVNYLGGEFGWYFELPDSGERSITNAVVRGDRVFFNSFTPSANPCTTGGSGFRFAIDLLNGGSPTGASFDNDSLIGISARDQVLNPAGIAATIVAIKQEGFLSEPVFIQDTAFTADLPAKVVKLRELPRGRFSWTELLR